LAAEGGGSSGSHLPRASISGGGRARQIGGGRERQLWAAGERGGCAGERSGSATVEVDERSGEGQAAAGSGGGEGRPAATGRPATISGEQRRQATSRPVMSDPRESPDAPTPTLVKLFSPVLLPSKH